MGNQFQPALNFFTEYFRYGSFVVYLQVSCLFRLLFFHALYHCIWFMLDGWLQRWERDSYLALNSCCLDLF